MYSMFHLVEMVECQKGFFEELGCIFGLWCLARDFNAVRFLVEKSVRGSVTKMMKSFLVFVEDCDLVPPW